MTFNFDGNRNWQQVGFHLHILARTSLQEVVNGQLMALAPLNRFYFEVMLFIPVIYINNVI